MNFPVFEKLKVEGYHLYPGTKAKPGLDIDLTPGPWLVIGVNGLGKSTLLLMLRHVLTGPVRARPAGFTGERSIDLLQINTNFFATRVIDGAKNARAYITVKFGAARLNITRRLSDLGIVEASLDAPDGVHSATTESHYQGLLTRAMGLATFDDVLRVLDRVTFFLEAREAPIWSVAAQYELFRALISPEHSAELRTLEGNIVSADSAARNLSASYYSLTKRRNTQMMRHVQSADIKAQLGAVTAKLEAGEAQEIKLQYQLEACGVNRSDARTEAKQADRKADDAAKRYEQLKYEALSHAFAGVSPTEQYLYLKIMAKRKCSVCSNPAEDFATELERRRENGFCLVCGQPRAKGQKVTSTAAALQQKAEEAYAELMAAREEQEQLNRKFAAAEDAFEAADKRLENVRQEVDTARRDAQRLRSKLPIADQTELAREESRIDFVRQEALRSQKERDDAESKISALILSLTKATEAIRDRLVNTFQKRADEFFAEKVRLVYAPRKDRIGQTGRAFEFPAFEIEMTSGATQAQFIRRSADQVSLSQREYLDMLFRISIIETIAGGTGSFVVDGPEGSLDAVFASRAGDLFAALGATAAGNTVIMAVNIVAGQFIPNTLRNYPSEPKRKKRLVNLIELGFPTTALTQLKTDYQAAVTNILALPAR